MQTLILGGGCFWCLEAVFQRVKGVDGVVSGYTGGAIPDPDYRSVCSGTTGHAEVIAITYDPERVSIASLLEIFWAVHDPTTLNRQGADTGTQYRSVIYYGSDEERAVIETAIKTEQPRWSDPIVTEVSPKETFYPAEAYHQNYYNENSAQGYCQFVVAPKVKKLLKHFPESVKEG